MFSRTYLNNAEVQISTVILSYLIQHTPLPDLYSQKPAIELDKMLSLAGRGGHIQLPPLGALSYSPMRSDNQSSAHSQLL